MSLNQYVKQRLTFDTVAPGILGANRTNALLVSVLDAETVANFIDIQAKHAQVRNASDTVPKLASSYMYGKFQFADGSVEYIGEPWIVASTIRAVTAQKLIVTLDEDVTVDTEAQVRAALTRNGITKFKIDTITS